MIIDTSALVSIMRKESDAQIYVSAIEGNARRIIAAPSYLEFCMVILGDRQGVVLDKIDEFLKAMSIVKIAFTPEMGEVAAAAFLQYGKGRGHPAQLNFGDCISYAVSKVEMMPLLFKGDDFRLTDVECALPASG